MSAKFTYNDEANYENEYGSSPRKDSDSVNRQRTDSTVSARKRASSILDKLHIPRMPKIDSDVHFDLDEFHGKSPHIEYPNEKATVAVIDSDRPIDLKPYDQNGVTQTIDSEKAQVLDDDPDRKARWRSIWLATIILFLISVQFSIYFSSLWPYLQFLDPNATETFFGFIVAAYSGGQIIASPIFAFWSKRSKSVRIPIACGICLTLVGNIIYLFTGGYPESKVKYILLGCRFIMGLAAGVTGNIRAYVATSSKVHERHRAIAQTTAAQSLGMTAGPIIQICFYPLKSNDKRGSIAINEYTGPALVSIIACIVLLILLIFFFKEYYSGLMGASKEDPYFVLPKFDKIAAALCIWFWFTMFFCVTNIETIESPYTMAIYDWTAEDATLYNGLILGGSGFISFCAYFVYAVYGRRFIRERIFITIGLCMLCLFYVITWPWPYFTGKMDYKYMPLGNTAHPYNGTLPSSWTTMSPTSLGTGSTIKINNDTTAEPVGCDDSFGWCRYTPWVPPEVYFCAYPLISLGFPTINVALSTLYSKILGPRRQNIMQSLMIMSGSFARLLGPIFISTVFQYYGPMISWGIIAAAVFSSIVCSILFYRRLIPLDIKPKIVAGQKFDYTGGTLHKF